ncbi:MAG: M6 family metalloprotease domain-containing protein, partial [Endomicrobiia bacterium]|nr:M6 family metalloprotease domain-containing protein [Endomicrobiia bacterium]
MKRHISGVTTIGGYVRPAVILLAAPAVFLLMAFSTPAVFAIPARPDPVEITQPDGATKFVARMVGDEYYSRLITDDGYTIVKAADGWWYYALVDSAGLSAPSDRRVGISAPPDSAEPYVAPRGPARRALENRRRRAVAPSPERRAQAITPTGAKEIIVIRVDFSDKVGAKTKAYFQDFLFNPGTYTLRGYFDEVSYQLLTVTGTIVGDAWYRSAKTMTYYGADSAAGTDDVNGNIYELAREAVQLADGDINFADYDKNGDGYVDHVLIIHAGDDQSNTPTSPNNIWSHKWQIGEAGELLDGVRVLNYTMCAETNAMGVFAHEFVHDLGAPDLYDYDYDGTPVGVWCLMSGGGHLNPPAHVSGYLKMDLDADPSNGPSGWLSPAVVTSAGPLQVKRLSDNASGSLFKFFAGGTKEYFLVENRHKSGFDAGLPESGILVWHIDESMPDGSGLLNDGTPGNSYYRAWVECPGNPLHNSTADKAGQGTLATAGYSSNDNQIAFHNATNPNSNTNRGVYSGVNIADIGARGAVMSLTVNSAGVIVPPLGAIPAPNPYFSQKGSMNFAVSEQMGAGNMKIRIYNFAGDRVRTLTNATLWDGKD